MLQKLMLLMCLVSSVALAQENADEAVNDIFKELERIQQQQLAQLSVEDPIAELPSQRASAEGPREPLRVSLPSPQEVVGTGKNAPMPLESSTFLQEQAQDAIDEAAFRDAVRNLFPLNPDQIVRLRELYENTKFAESTSPKTPPRPTATSQLVSLAPGSTPPVIRLSQGFVSSLVFLDSTGAPWPITAYDLGNPSAFNIQWDKTSNTLMIQALDLYTYGNLAIRLRDLNTPVMLTLIPGQRAVDYRVDLRIQGIGPNAQLLPTGTGLPDSADPVLLKVLDGVPPPGGQRMKVQGGEADVWVKGDKMYLRTQLTVLSPGWIATMSSADGTKAYEMNVTPVLLVSHHGRVRNIKIEGL